VDLLISNELLQRIPRARERFSIGPEMVAPVKGRKREVHVHEVGRFKKTL